MLLFENHLVEDTMATEPLFFRIYLEDDKKKLEELLKNKPHVSIHDQIDTQLDDLIKSTLPKRKPSQEELEQLKKNHIGDLSMQEYGVWVFYPWSNRLVHLLDEEEFIEVRTNRNIYKITREERDILGRQKIGVVGLSVGQSISITMAMERSFGEIRLADFDVLELTNINRIRTGVHNLGLPKVAIVAREIKEIDPYLKVTCFYDGLTEENMQRYFTEGGNLDIVVDECDSLDIKIQLRNVAKPLGIPVVMDTSDRGTLDVERFDLEPDRPILHGLIDHLDYSQVKHLKTNEEKVPFLLAMIGIETVSTRLKASMIEVGQTITTWPQLASAVTLGGALGADVCRRIILDQYHESGRYWVDMSDLIGDKVESKDEEYEVIDYTAPELTTTQMEAEAATFAANNIDPLAVSLNDDEIKDLVSAAALAPSGGNTQPWKWLAREEALYLFHDEKESASWIDFKNSASYVALGAAIENLKIKAGASKLTTAYSLFPNGEDSKLVAAFNFHRATEHQYLNNLSKGLELRLTNRKKGDRRPIPEELISSLKSLVHLDSDAELFIIQDEASVKKVADVVSASERIRFLHPQGHHDFYTKEIRWTSETDGPVTEGLDIKTLELSESDKTGLIVASSPEVIKLLNKWGGGAAFEKLSKNSIASSSAIGLIVLPEYSSTNFIKGGQALQRVWLSANLNELSLQPLTAPLFMFARLNKTDGDGMTPKMISELGALENDLNTIFPAMKEKQGIFMFRLSYADEASIRSFRRPLNEILNFSEA